MKRITILLTTFLVLLISFEGFSYNPILPAAVAAKIRGRRKGDHDRQCGELCRTHDL